MSKHYSFILNIILLFFLQQVFAQKEHSVWYFGNQMGFKINESNEVNLLNDNVPFFNRCSAVISDCEGDLLFYTDSKTVYNKQHQVMLNGTNLFGCSTYNGATIVKRPGNNNHYYIFTIDGSDSPADSYRGVFCTTIDMDLDGGLGAVVQKNVMISNSGSKKLTIVKKSNSNDLWLIVFNFADRKIDTFLIGENSFSYTASLYIGSQSMEGCMKSNRDFTKVVMSNTWDDDHYLDNNNAVNIFDFDNLTGTLSNKKTIGFEYYRWVRGIEMSSNGRYLYVSYTATYLEKGIPPPSKAGSLWQYDLMATDIESSKFKLYGDYNYSPHTMQLGIDNKIYIANFKSKFLSIINHPNNQATNCDLVMEGLKYDNYVYYSLPNMTNVFQDINHRVENLCEGSTTTFKFLGTDNVTWDFGDGVSAIGQNVSHVYQLPGKYYVNIYGSSAVCNRFSIEIFKTPNVALIPNDYSVCGDIGKNYKLADLEEELLSLQGNDDFAISFYATQNDLNLGINELHDVVLMPSSPLYIKMYNKRNEECQVQKVLMLLGLQSPQVNLDEKYYICNGVPIQIVVQNGFDNYFWSNGSALNQTVISTPGTYLLTIDKNYPQKSCKSSYVFEVISSSIATIDEVRVDDVQNNNNVEVFVSGLGDYIYSLDGHNYQESHFFDNLSGGIYTVYVKDKNGCGEVVDDLLVVSYSKYFTPNEDGLGDTWNVQLGNYKTNGILITLYDRFGNLITSFNSQNKGWDGLINGKPAISDDYWFVIQKEDGRKYNGHFSLKR